MKFIDICAGIGGFRSGLEQAGHECVGYVEVDRHARRSYEKIYDTSGEWTGTDITKICPDDIPESDLWCFGFPCQDISVAGKQKGLEGSRSGIFYSIVELVKGKSAEGRPEWLLVENVKNLLSVNGGRDFTEVLSELSEAGYDCEWHVVNSKDHGVPQNRERVFIVGHLRGKGGRQVFPLAGAGGQASGERQDEKKGVTGERAVYMPSFYECQLNGTRIKEPDEPMFTVVSYTPHGVAVPKQIVSGDQAHRVYKSDGISVTLKAEGGGVGAKTGLYAVPKIRTIATGINQRESVQRNDGIARALTATDYKEPQPVAVPCLTPERENKRQNGRRFKEDGDPMFTLTAQDVHGVLVYEGEEYHIRRLTPRECFRLQGFTDSQFDRAREVNSNSQLYKQAGNAVTVNVAKMLGEILKEAEHG